MNDSALTAELESLIQGYVEGELTPLECARFQALIEASPDLVTPILTNLQMDTLIRQAASQKAGPDSKILSLPESAPDARAQSQLEKSRRSGRFAVGVALAACLVVLAASGA